MKKWFFRLLLPSWLYEMSVQMNTDPTRLTAHPFWQVRCRRFLPTSDECCCHHWELVDGDGVFFRCDTQEEHEITNYLWDNHQSWCEEWVEDEDEETPYNSVEEVFRDRFTYNEWIDLPEGISKVFMQEVEEVVSTHLTKADAEWFIKRKQHDYPKLYTYVESAYWSPQLRKLQDWIKSLTQE
jgi:hypothetical protein